jgi:hypothetical protein
LHVCCWHFSEVPAAASNLRFQRKSGPRRFHDQRGMQCYCLFAECWIWNVRSQGVVSTGRPACGTQLLSAIVSSRRRRITGAISTASPARQSCQTANCLDLSGKACNWRAFEQPSEVSKWWNWLERLPNLGKSPAILGDIPIFGRPALEIGSIPTGRSSPHSHSRFSLNQIAVRRDRPALRNTEAASS